MGGGGTEGLGFYNNVCVCVCVCVCVIVWIPKPKQYLNEPMVTESIVLQFHLLQSIDSIKKQNNCAKLFMNHFLFKCLSYSFTSKIKHSLENSIVGLIFGRVNVADGGTNC